MLMIVCVVSDLTLRGEGRKSWYIIIIIIACVCMFYCVFNHCREMASFVAVNNEIFPSKGDKIAKKSHVNITFFTWLSEL